MYIKYDIIWYSITYYLVGVTVYKTTIIKIKGDIMRQIYLLTTYLLKAFIKDTFNHEKNFLNTMYKVITGIIILLFLIFFAAKFNFILLAEGVQYLFIPIILLIASIAYMILGIYLILSNVSFADDNEFLLSLPVNNKIIFISKFIFIEMMLTPISILIAIVLFTYGILSKASVAFYIYSLITSLLISITPITYGIFITLILNRICIKGNNKESLRRIFTIVSVIFSIGIVYFILISFMAPNSMVSLIAKSSKFDFNLINIILPLNTFLSKALIFSNSSIGFNSIVFSIILAVFLIIFNVFVGKKLYYKILLNSSDVSKSKDSKKYTFYKDNDSVLRTLMKRDFIALLRSNQFFLYTIGIFPIFVLIVATLIPLFKSIVTIESLEKNYIIVYVYLVSLSSLFAGYNVTAATSFSREGRYLPMLLQMPINIKTLLLSKVLIALSLSSLMIIVNLVVLAFLGLPILIYILMGISMFVFTLLIVMSSILNDVSHTNIKWMYEKDLVKGNLSLYKSCIYSIIYTPLILVLHLILNLTDISYSNQFYLLATVFIIVEVILTIRCYKKILSKLNTLYDL
ncbi:ABC transporter permease [Clostridium baratii]|uniref:ABC transporter permease n=2 Tax=Clostridium baratii TaxID=1561 RepID=A0A174TDS9_9CLOT|nr:ABC transporter permease [Clostridium baratii]